MADSLIGFILRQLEQFPQATFLGSELRSLNAEEFDRLCKQRWLCQLASQPSRQLFPCHTGSVCEAPGREVVPSQGKWWAVCNCQAGEPPIEICLEDLQSFKFNVTAFAQALAVHNRFRGQAASLTDRLFLVGEYEQGDYTIAVVLALLGDRPESLSTFAGLLSQLPSGFSAVIVVTPTYMPHPTALANLERLGIFVACGIDALNLQLPVLKFKCVAGPAKGQGQRAAIYECDNVFRRCGGVWQVRFKGGEFFNVLPLLGASYIHHLLASSEEPCQAIDIVCKAAIDCCEHAMTAKDAIENGLQQIANPILSGIGSISDWEAVRSYRDELIELRAAIEEARRENNNVLVQQYENDLAIVSAKLNEAMGLGGKLRKIKDKRKNIRDGFRNAVNRVIEKQIAPSSSALAEHLKIAISLGNTPRYVGEAGLVWETRPVVDAQII